MPGLRDVQTPGAGLVRPLDENDPDVSTRLHARVQKTIGTIASGNPTRAERARENVRKTVRDRAMDFADATLGHISVSLSA